MSKKLLFSISAALLLIPGLAFGATAVGWNLNNITDGFISPNLVNGVLQALRVTSTATSTIANLNGVYYISPTTTDIGAAINAAYAAGYAPGVTIMLPTGTYNTATPMSCATNGKACLIIGQGASTVINYTGTGTSTIMNFRTSVGTLAGLFNYKLVGPNSSGTTVGVEMGGSNGASNVTVEGLQIRGFGTGMAFGANTYLTNVTNTTFNFNGKNLRVTQASNAGEELRFTNDLFADSVAPDDCVFVEQTSNIIFTNASFDDCQLHFGDTVNMGAVIGSHFENPAGNQIATYDMLLIDSSPATNITVTDSQFYNSNWTTSVPNEFIKTASQLELTNVTINKLGGKLQVPYLVTTDEADAYVSIRGLRVVNTPYANIWSGSIAPILYDLPTSGSIDFMQRVGIGTTSPHTDSSVTIVNSNATIDSFDSDGAQSVTRPAWRFGASGGNFVMFTLGTNANPIQRLGFTPTGNLGIATNTPFAKLAVHAMDGDTNTSLFAIASSTSNSTTTVFAVSNTGSTTATNGFNIANGCFAINGTCIGTSVSGASYPFTNTTFGSGVKAAATTTALIASGGFSAASSTLGFFIATTTTATSSIANLAGVLNANSFAGSDIGAKINAAYAQSGPNPIITVPANSNFSYSTPIVFNTAGKNVTLDCQGATLTYTGGGSTIGITVDTTQTGTANYIPPIIKNCRLVGPSSAGNTVGVFAGGTNGSAGFSIQHSVIRGWGVGTEIGDHSYLHNYDDVTWQFNGVAIYESGTSDIGERMSISNSLIADCVVIEGCVHLTTTGGTNWDINTVSFDDAQLYADYFDSSPGASANTINIVNSSFENPIADGYAAYSFIEVLDLGPNVLNISNSVFINDATASVPAFFINNGGNVNLSNVSVMNNGGAQVPNMIHNQSAADKITSVGFTDKNNAVGALYSGTPSGSFIIGNATQPNFFISSTTAGIIGVGTTTPWAQFAINPIGGSAPNAFVIGSSSATRFIVTNGGKVGIGTTSPSQLFSVTGNGYLTGKLGVGLASPTGTFESVSDVFGGGGSDDYQGTFSLVTSPGLGVTIGYDQANNYGVLYARNRGATARDMLIGSPFDQYGYTMFKSTGNVGISTSSPYSRLAVTGNVGSTAPLLVLDAVDSGYATTTVFKVANNGSTTAANGFNITAGCYALNGTCLSTGGGGGGISDPFTHPSLGISATSSLMIDASGRTFSNGPTITVSTTTSTGDYTSLITAFAALPSTGGSIELTCGTFALGSGLLIDKSNVVIKGQGRCTSLTWNGATVPTAVRMIDQTQRFNIVFQDLVVTNTGAAGSGTCYDFTAFTLSHFIRADCSSANIAYMASTTNTHYNTIESPRMSVSGAGSYGIYLSSGVQAAPISNTIIDARGIGDASTIMYYINAHHTICVSCHSETTPAVGMEIGQFADDSDLNVYLEQNTVNLQIDGQPEGTTVSGFIADADTTNITGFDTATGLTIKARVQYEPWNVYQTGQGSTKFGIGIGTSTNSIPLVIAATSSTATFNQFRIDNSNPTATSPVGIVFSNQGGKVDTARLYANPGATFTNSKFNISVADSSLNLQDRLTIDVNGNVGIGTTSPYAALSVAGATGVVANYYTATSTTPSVFTGGLTAFASSTMGAGTQAAGLTISGGATTTGNAYLLGLLRIGATNTFGSAQVNVTKSTSGGVGGEVNIMNTANGATNNQANLNFTLLGNGGSTGTGTSDQAQIGAKIVGAGNLTDMFFSTLNGSSNTEKVRITGAGNVGIGTTTPFAKLSVEGNANDSVFQKTLFAIASTTASATSTHFSVLADGTMFAPNTTTNGAAQTGTWCYDANGQFIRDTATCAVSARKFKKDIVPLNVGIDELMLFKPVSYYKKDPLGPDDAGEQMGFIADDSPDQRLITHDSNGDIHGFRYDQLTALIVKSIQDQQHEIENLKVGKVMIDMKRSVEENYQWGIIAIMLLWIVRLEARSRRK